MLPHPDATFQPYYGGLGDTTNAAISAGAAGSTLGLAIASGASAIPVAGAVIAAGVAITALIESIIANSGCGQTCVISSQDANRVGDAMLANLRAYVALPVRTVADQQAALANFDYAWSQLVALCGNTQLGNAGVNCISDRQSGACTWKSSQGGWSQSSDGTCKWTDFGPAGSGDFCWNYFSGMRDPIANDPCAQPNTVASSASGVFDSAASSLGVSTSTLLLGLAAVLFLSMNGTSKGRARA